MLVATVWMCRSIGKINRKRNNADELMYLVGGSFESSAWRHPSLAWWAQGPGGLPGGSIA